MFLPLWNVVYEVGKVGPPLKFEFYVPAKNAADALADANATMELKDLGVEAILKVEKTKMMVFLKTSVD